MRRFDFDKVEVGERVASDAAKHEPTSPGYEYRSTGENVRFDLNNPDLEAAAVKQSNLVHFKSPSWTAGPGDSPAVTAYSARR